MGTDKRDRKKANRAARVAAEQADEARRRRVAFIRNAVILAIALLVVAAVLSSCSSSGSDGEQGEGAAPTEDTTTTLATTACPEADGSSPRQVTFASEPPTCIDPEKRYTAVFDTTQGSFTVALDTSRTPATTNNFVVLARYHYYDGTDLFRTEAASGIVQGGSPHTQDGADPGPGYLIDDEALPFTADDYGPGTLAMARTSAPNSASAQFFFLANEGGRYLGDPQQLGNSAGTYAKFGNVTQGLDVVAKIAALDNGGGAPSTKVTITKVTIAES